MLNSSLAEQPSRLISNYKDHKAYILFFSSLRSKYTKIKYDGCLQKYLKHPFNEKLSSLNEILAKDPKVIEGEIIEQLIKMKGKGMSYSTLSVYLAALNSFFSINDVSINIKKLSRFVGEQERKYEYRSYTHDEIARLLSLCDERGKAIVMLLASTGMRVGAIPELRLKHLRRYDLVSGSHLYRIIVYATSKKYKHITYCTPECARVLDEYLEYRGRITKNNVSKNPETGDWGPPDAYLITRQFNINDVPSSSGIFKKPMTAQGLRAYIVNRLKKMNLRNSWKTSEKSTDYIASHKNELHPCHSFRIFAVTQMQRARIDKTIREMLVGHSTGLDAVYFKASEEEILLEFSKAIELLSINKESKLRAKIKKLEGQNNIQDNLLENRLIKKEEELESLRQQEMMNKDAIINLSDQVNFLIKEISSLKR